MYKNKFYPYYINPTIHPEFSNPKWINMYDLSKSYKKSIKVLLENETQSFTYFEYDIYPALVLIHNYLEQIFKSLILKNTGEIRASHNLDSLKCEVVKLHKKFEINKSQDFILWLNKENPQNASFRYNLKKNGTEVFVDSTKDTLKGISLSYIILNINNIFSIIDDYFQNELKI